MKRIDRKSMRGWAAAAAVLLTLGGCGASDDVPAEANVPADAVSEDGGPGAVPSGQPAADSQEDGR